jgi:hypothetical protein
MLINTPALESQSLYDRDILLWVEETTAKLRARDFENLDLENLIEEVESLGISQKKELLSRLVTLLEHLLKRLYIAISPHSPDEYREWERTIRNQRCELEISFKFAPSLKTRWNDSFEDAWAIALKAVREECESGDFPSEWQYPSDLDTILNRDFWEETSSSDP